MAGERWPVSGRAVFGMLNQLTWYISIKYISLTDSSAIYYSAPVYVSVLAFALLGEPFGVIELTSVLVTLVGVTLISKPGFLPFFRQDTLADVSAFNVSTGAPTLTNEGRSNGLIRIHNQTSTQFLISALNSTSLSSDNYTMTTLPVALSANETSIVDTSDVMVFGVSGHVIGMSLAFGGALTFAFTNICLRKMRKTPTEVTATWFSVFTIVSCVPLAIYMEVLRLPVNTIEWIVVILVGVFSTLGQVAFTLALKIEKAGPVSVAQTLNIVIVLFYQVVFFHEPVTTTSLAGVMLIIGSVLLIGLKDTFMQQRLMVRVIKRIRRQGQFDLHSPNGTCRKDSTLHSVKAGDSLPAKPSFCTCYTLPNKDTETAAVTDTPASLPVSHLQVPSSLTVDSEMDPELKAKLQRKLEH